MYCARCGKQIPEGKKLCNDCAFSTLASAAESVQTYREPIKAEPKVYKPGSNLKLSIIALILSTFSFFGTLIMVLLSPITILLTPFIMAPLIVLSIIFGAVTFKKAKIPTAEGVCKDNPTFIFGLIAFIQGLATVAEILTLYMMLSTLR